MISNFVFPVYDFLMIGIYESAKATGNPPKNVIYFVGRFVTLVAKRSQYAVVNVDRLKGFGIDGYMGSSGADSSKATYAYNLTFNASDVYLPDNSNRGLTSQCSRY